jgi:hypothetical protein
MSIGVIGRKTTLPNRYPRITKSAASNHPITHHLASQLVQILHVSGSGSVERQDRMRSLPGYAA